MGPKPNAGPVTVNKLTIANKVPKKNATTTVMVKEFSLGTRFTAPAALLERVPENQLVKGGLIPALSTAQARAHITSGKAFGP